MCRAAGRSTPDSDIYKWIEADAFVLQNHDNASCARSAEGAIDTIVAAQQPDAISTRSMSRKRAAERHTRMADHHELYCLGHMLQAAVAWKRATGETKLLDSGLKMVATCCLISVPIRKPLLDGHPEVEMALIEWLSRDRRQALPRVGSLSARIRPAHQAR